MDLQNLDVGFERSTFFKPFAEGLRKNATLCTFLPHFPSILALLASDFSAARSATSNGHSVGHSGGVPV